MSSQRETTEGIETALATLQPIRDLAKNWDIDIASCLEDYLHDIVGDLPAEHRQEILANQQLNFAQAALVLQNSSNIYSRKVEYLHRLVYSTVEGLAQVHGSAAAASRKRASAIDDDVDDFLQFDPNLDFLLLNDAVPMDRTPDHRKIDIPLQSGRYSLTMNNGNHWETPNSSRRISLPSPGRSVTRFSMPGNSTLHTSSSQENGSTPGPRLGMLDAGSMSLYGNTFKAGQDGFLCLPGSEPAGTEEGGQTDAVDVPMQQDGDDDGFGAFQDNDGMDDYDDHDNDGPGFAMNDDPTDNNLDGPSEIEAQAHVPQRRVTFADTVQPQKKEKQDPWAMLDPHQVDKRKPCPLKIGKTIRLPPGLDALPSECVTGARTRRPARRETDTSLVTDARNAKQTTLRRSLAAETFQATMAARKRRHSETIQDSSVETGMDGEIEQDLVNTNTARPVVPLKGLVFGNEFSYIAKATASRKAAERRELKKRQQQEQASANLVPVYDDDNDDDVGGGFAFGGDGDDDDNYDFDATEDGPIETNTGMLSVDDAYRSDEHADNDAQQTMSFAELCRAHIRAFAKGAERYASETKLSQRVGHWQDRLVPLLEEEERRPVFDIHEYGQRVVESMQENMQNHKTKNMEEKPLVRFQELTRNCPDHEVCRMFLATLSLANSGNLQLIDEARNGASLELELLDKEIERPMETYLAPSLISAGDMDTME